MGSCKAMEQRKTTRNEDPSPDQRLGQDDLSQEKQGSMGHITANGDSLLFGGHTW